MQLSIKQVAELVDGSIEGSSNVFVSNVNRLSEADSSSICFLANLKYEKQLYSSKAAAVFVEKNFKAKMGDNHPVLIRVADPYSAFALLLERFERATIRDKVGLEQPISMHESVQHGKDVFIGAFSYLSENVRIADEVKIYPQVYIGENVQIGKGTVIFPGVKIYANVKIGQYCTIEAGAIIGSEGFGFAPQKDGSLKRVPQIGNVTLGNHVSIGANTTIDRATVGSTTISSGVKLDNLVHIGHNVSIGQDSGIAAQSGIAGSTTIGDNCLFGGQVGVVGHLDIANKTQIAPKGGVMSSIKEEGRVLLGAPVMDFTHTKKVWVIWKKLPDLQKRIELLEEMTKERSSK